MAGSAETANIKLNDVIPNVKGTAKLDKEHKVVHTSGIAKGFEATHIEGIFKACEHELGRVGYSVWSDTKDAGHLWTDPKTGDTNIVFTEKWY